MWNKLSKEQIAVIGVIVAIILSNLLSNIFNSPK